MEELRGDLARLQESIAKHNAELQQVRAHMIEHSQAYHATVAAIEARLQVGTTPGNPVLVQQWNESQQQLSAFNGDLSALNNLTTTVGGDATMANYLVGSVRAAFGLSGAVEADHEQLTTLEDETNRTEVLIERLMTELTDDLNRQTNYLAAERANLSTLALAIQNGESLGPALTTRSRTALTQVAEANAAAAPTVSYQQPAMIGGRKPLVVIRFDRPNVNYDQALYNAVSRALERKPQAMFDLVAVAAAASGGAEGQANSVAARRYADQVLRALSEMGLPANRVTLSGATDATSHFNQVQIYVR